MNKRVGRRCRSHRDDIDLHAFPRCRLAPIYANDSRTMLFLSDSDTVRAYYSPKTTRHNDEDRFT